MNKKFFYIFFIVLISSYSINAQTYSDRTFLTPRKQNQNLPMMHTTWHELQESFNENHVGGSLQATAFYQKSDNQKDLAKYFGCYNYRISEFQDFFAVSYAAFSDDTYHFAPCDIFHSPDVSGQKLADKIILRPSQESMGIHLGYHQDLNKLIDGLFLKIDAPIVYIKNSLGYTSTGGSVSQSAFSWGTYSFSGPEYSVLEFLTGTATSTNQSALTKGKWHNGNSKTRIADIDIAIGYNFLYEDYGYINASIGCTIPTGNKPKADYIWESVVGNGGHFGLYGNFDSSLQLYKHDRKTIDLIFGFDFKYLFKGTEKRIPGFKESNLDPSYPNITLWGLYDASGETGKTGVFPAANVLAQKVDVEPGYIFDGMFEFAIGWKRLLCELGYNLFLKKEESVSIKSWNNDKYGTVGYNHNPDINFDATTISLDQCYKNIQSDDLLIYSITTPKVTTHKLFGNVGWVFNELKNPTMIGFGASYEYPKDNNALRQWALWLKGGFNF